MSRRRSNIAARGMGWVGLAARVSVIGALSGGVGAGASGCAARPVEASARALDDMKASTRPSDSVKAFDPLSAGGASKASDGGMGDGTSLTPPPQNLWERDQAAVIAAKAQIEVSAQALGLMTKPKPVEDPPTQALEPITEGKTPTPPTPPSPKPQPQITPTHPDAEQSVAAHDARDGGRCDTGCEAAEGICASRRTICEIAGAHPLDASFEVECVWASQVCERAQARCRDCEGSP